MIVCLCRGKSDRDVLRAIDAGAESVADLMRCGIGTDCGACHSTLRGMLAAAARERSSCGACATHPAEPSAAAIA